MVGQAPLAVTVYELEKLRCNLCGEVYTAEAPEDVGTEKYDASAASMIALPKYGTGFPFHRLEGLQKDMEIPLPASTQWEIVAETAQWIEPAYQELMQQAAQGEVLHNDDTEAQTRFRFLHVSTDEVYGSLGSSASLHRDSCIRAQQPLLRLQSRQTYGTIALQRYYSKSIIILCLLGT